MSITGKAKSMSTIEYTVCYKDSVQCVIRELVCYKSFGIWKYRDNDRTVSDMPIDVEEEIIRSEFPCQELKTLATIKLMEKNDV